MVDQEGRVGQGGAEGRVGHGRAGAEGLEAGGLGLELKLEQARNWVMYMELE